MPTRRWWRSPLTRSRQKSLRRRRATLTEILVEPGQTVDVGVVLARIGGAEVAGRGSQVAEAEAPAAPVDPPAPVAGNGHTRPRNGGPPISPVVRRMADEHQIDLSLVSGSGRLGRVTKRDCVAYLETGAATAVEAPPPPTLHSESPVHRGVAARDPRPATRRPGDNAAALPHAPPDRRAHGALVADRRAVHDGGRGRHERDRVGTRAAVVPAVRGARDDRRAARVPDVERHAGGRSA